MPKLPHENKNTTGFRFEVFDSFHAVERWLDEVRSASDEHRNEFGFVAKSEFHQYARRGGLFVLVAHTAGEARYAGHLMFDRAFPRARIRQMFARENFRCRGAATLLLDRLREILVAESFISIYARVAEDLVDANAFWERRRFYVQRAERGGETRNRQILVRCHELASPQLFPPSGINEHNPLGLLDSPDGIPMFLLDMNVLFDLNPRRLRREYAVRLVLAERMNFCRLAISSEIREELQRSLQNRTTDPMEAVADTFPCFPIAATGDGEQILRELVPIVFPHVGPDRPLTPNERSDLRHTVTAISNDLSGLVTNDTALLAAAKAIEDRFGTRILSSASLFTDESPRPIDIEAFGHGTERILRLLPVLAGNEPAVRQLLIQVGLSGSDIAIGWLPAETRTRVSVRCAIWNGGSCIGYITWPSWATSDIVVARAAIDERDEQALEAARMLLLHLVDYFRDKGARQVRLELPARQSHLREVANGIGFRGSPSDRHLVKFALGRVLMPERWQGAQEILAAAKGPRLPVDAPEYRGMGQQLLLSTPDGNRVHVSLEQLETLLSPALFCLRGRPAVITPIQRVYAEPLLGHSPQTSLLPQRSTSLFADRLYLCKPSAIRHFKRGTLMLFYESSRGRGGREIVAIARVLRAYLKACDAFSVSDLEPSVLSADRLDELGTSTMKTVTVFDNIFSFPHPVGLATLKNLGCGRPTDLISTRPITDMQLRSILAEGFRHA